MNRRTFFPWFTGGISSSFILGTAGGIGVGAVGTAAGIQASRPRWSKQSYSQQGEDLIVESLADFLRIQKLSYLDVGAADPIRMNNTYRFYEKKLSGVLVEPNPACCQRLRATRPRDKVINAGIGFTDQKEADYYIIGGGVYSEDLNTFSKKQVDSYKAKSNGISLIEKVVRMPLVDINNLMEEHFHGAPHFISIDTEGVDLEILRTINFSRFRPSILCVETLIFGTSLVENQILDLMKSHDYTIRGSTFVNTIFVDNRALAALG
jgi:FkbM family methyltransferase